MTKAHASARTKECPSAILSSSHSGKIQRAICQLTLYLQNDEKLVDEFTVEELESFLNKLKEHKTLIMRKIDALLIVTAFLLAFFIYRLEKHLHLIAVQNSNVNYFSPPPCPNSSDARLLCRENMHILQNLTSISIVDDLENDELTFEKFLLKKNRNLRGGVIFMSSTTHDGDDNFRMSNRIDTDYFRSYKLDTDESVSDLVESFVDILDEQDHINLLNIDLDSLNRSPESQIKILEGILKQRSTVIDQIFLLFTIPSNINLVLLHQFYLFLYRIYFRYDFGVYSARQRGTCALPDKLIDRRIQNHCVYKLSFRKIDFRNDYPVFAPTTGVGLPAEERERVESTLRQAVSSTEENMSPEICNLLYFRANRVENARLPCYETLYFEPKFSDNLNRVLYYDSTGSGYNLSEIVERFPIYDRIFLNLKGLEFDLLEELFASRLIVTFSQITVIYHLWINEESANYRKFYTQMIYFEKLNYKMNAAGDIDQCDKSLGRKDCYKIAWRKVIGAELIVYAGRVRDAISRLCVAEKDAFGRDLNAFRTRIFEKIMANY
uniref:COMM domain-containing protein n=1 Tax=Romanomermis culicivorax TaxID=13658 RepID=A0A915LBV4_ROMCU